MDVKKMINSANKDGSIDRPQITYMDMSLVGAKAKHFNQFIEETKKHDNLRGQSVLKVLPELAPFFS